MLRGGGAVDRRRLRRHRPVTRGGHGRVVALDAAGAAGDGPRPRRLTRDRRRHRRARRGDETRDDDRARAGGLLAFLMAARLRRHRTADLAAPAAHAGLALCTFSIATVQGAGLVLVPALVPLCVGSGASGGTGRIGPLGSALVAIGLHLAAMLATTAAVAGGIAAIGRWLSSRARPRRAGPF